MQKFRVAVGTLRVVSLLTVLLGLMALSGGLISGQMVGVFGHAVPAWVFGALVSFVGVRYWLRLRAIDEQELTKSW